MEKLFKVVGGVVLTFALMTVLAVVRGAVLVKLWSWFVVERFHVTSLTLGYAIGLSIIVGFLVYQFSSADQEANQGKSYGEVLVAGFFLGLSYTFLVWAMGAIVHSMI
jgi:hypothetical protein